MRIRPLLAALALIAAPLSALPAQPAAAQAPRGPDLAAQHAAMDRLAALMLGDWEGEANVPGPTPRRVFQREHIERDMDGLLLVIHGHGFATAERTGAPIFNALGIISYDDARQIYEFRAYNDGRATTATARFLDNGAWQWTMNFAPILIRYTISFGDGRWTEQGEMSRDNGATWMPTVTLNLRKIG